MTCKHPFRSKRFGDLKNVRLTHFLPLTAAGVVNAVGITLFLSPLNLLDSGISGLSIFLAGLTPLPLSVFLVVLNLPLYLFALRRIGPSFCLYSVYTIAVYSVFSWLLQYVIPFGVDVMHTSPIVGDDRLLGAVFGGVISGLGSGLTIRYGGAVDGIEVLAVSFAKKLGLSVGGFVMVFNVLLYLVAALVHGSWQLPLYSIIAYAIGLKAVDFVVDGLDKAKAASVITTQEEKLSAALSENLGRGVTILPAKGYYTGENKSMLYCVVNRFQINKLKKIIREIDPKAFVTITDISDAFGATKKLANYLPEEKRGIGGAMGKLLILRRKHPSAPSAEGEHEALTLPADPPIQPGRIPVQHTAGAPHPAAAQEEKAAASPPVHTRDPRNYALFHPEPAAPLRPASPPPQPVPQPISQPVQPGVSPESAAPTGAPLTNNRKEDV